MAYTLIKNQDTYTLDNTDVLPLVFTLQRLNGCYDYEEVVSSTTLNSTENYTFDFPQDGEYVINIVQNAVQSTETIKYYLDLENSIISSIKDILCGCTCSGCEECNNCENNLDTLIKIFSFIALTSTEYDATIASVQEQIKCLLNIEISCLNVQEMVTGDADTETLLKQIVSIYYLAFYFKEFNEAFDTEEEEYIKVKFNFSSVSKCISKLGIDINDIEDSL